MAIAAFAGCVALVMLVARPWLMTSLFGGDFDYERGGLVLVSVGMGLYLSAATLNQALLAHGARAPGRAGWVGCAVTFALFLLLAEFDDPVLAVEVAFVARGRPHCARCSGRCTGAPDILSSWPLPGSATPPRTSSLDGTDGNFRLSEHRGERVVLLFYPGDNTTVCTDSSAPTATRPRASRRWTPTVVGISHAERRLPPLLDRQARPERAAARRSGQRGREGVRRSQGAARHQPGGDRSSTRTAASATATTTCSGSTSRPSTSCATRSSRCRARAPDRCPRRSRSPPASTARPSSANGGYTCGLVAGLVGAEEVTVSLRARRRSSAPLERGARRRARRSCATATTLVAEGEPARAAARRARRRSPRGGGRRLRRPGASAGRPPTPSPPASPAAPTASRTTGCASSRGRSTAGCSRRTGPRTSRSRRVRPRAGRVPLGGARLPHQRAGRQLRQRAGVVLARLTARLGCSVERGRAPRDPVLAAGDGRPQAPGSLRDVRLRRPAAVRLAGALDRGAPGVICAHGAPLPDLSILRSHLRTRGETGANGGDSVRGDARGRLLPRLHLPQGGRAEAAPRGSRPADARRWSGATASSSRRPGTRRSRRSTGASRR